jgi:hypothetical protein
MKREEKDDDDEKRRLRRKCESIMKLANIFVFFFLVVFSLI